MKNIIGIILILIAFYSCRDISSAESKYKKNDGVELGEISFLDSLKAFSKLNIIDTFDIEKLKTNDFSQMIPINKKLFQIIYPYEEGFSENSFFIYSYIPTNNDYLTLITYQKNYEGENYRVDYIDLLNIDSTGKQLDKIRLAGEDNEVLTYKVLSFLTKDTLKVIEQISSEPYFEPPLDTLYTTEYTFELNGKIRIDTLEIRERFEIRKH